jgi:ABC-type antimicrobial peptide transport system permease subunit
MRSHRTLAEIGFVFGLLLTFVFHHVAPDMKVWAWLAFPVFFAAMFPVFLSEDTWL